MLQLEPHLSVGSLIGCPSQSHNPFCKTIRSIPTFNCSSLSRAMRAVRAASLSISSRLRGEEITIMHVPSCVCVGGGDNGEGGSHS